uniref:NADH-ubiquinone oxidoreductase chain 4L n=1 Tax=Chrysaora pacifica TaxID=1911418 RepID=A0A6G7GEG2_9CNID|nr:NADH dehydrogenase subunit 4L [Chrysaora pacifica]QIH96595.1 NADH dehydrogenase subunit 4L [Chrysaora pacifica]
MRIKSFIITSLILFILGILGVSLNRTNLILLLMSVELMLLAASFLFIIASSFFDILFGQIFTIIVLTVAAAESAIGLAIIVTYFRIRGKISIKLLNTLKG